MYTVFRKPLQRWCPHYCTTITHFLFYYTPLFIIQVRTGFPGHVLALEPLFYKYGIGYV